MSRDDLENLLRNHLSRELDPHRGHAARAFESQVIKPMEVSLNNRRRHWHAVRSWSLVATAMAACIVIGYSVPHFFNNSPTGIEIASNPDRSGIPLETQTVGFQQTHIQKSIDAGAVMLDNNIPGRKIILQEIKQYNWNDPTTGGQFRITEPNQRDIYLPVHQQ